jgi:hypothetical protein
MMAALLNAITATSSGHLFPVQGSLAPEWLRSDLDADATRFQAYSRPRVDG